MQCATHLARRLQLAGNPRLLIVLVATVGGSLKDEFEIPGSDTQRATDLIESEFAADEAASWTLSRRAGG